MKILIVGAGAVGKVYGYHLNKAAVEVSFLVKEKYAEAARAGFTLYPRTKSGPSTPVTWTDYKVLTTREEVKKEYYDYVIFAMSSPALRTGWMEDFLQAVPESVIVSLQPGMFDQDYISKRITPSKIINGTVSIVAYDAPMEGEKDEKPGTAFWVPPASFSMLSGLPSQVDLLNEFLTKGGIPARRVRNAHQENIVVNVTLTLIVEALKQCDWSFDKLIKSPVLKLLSAAIPEAAAVQAKQANINTPKYSKFLHPLLFKATLKMSKHLVPFDLEKYMKLHFTKMGDQMSEHLDQLIEYGTANQLPVGKIEALEAGVQAESIPVTKTEVSTEQKADAEAAFANLKTEEKPPETVASATATPTDTAVKVEAKAEDATAVKIDAAAVSSDSKDETKSADSSSDASKSDSKT